MPPSDEWTLNQTEFGPEAGSDEVSSATHAEAVTQAARDEARGEGGMSGTDCGTLVQGSPDALRLDEGDADPGLTPRLSGEAEEQARQRSRGVPQVRDYDVRKLLGKGAFGEVWLAEEKRTGKRVAIKFFAHGTGEQWESLQAEVKQLASLHSDPGIVKLIDFEPDPGPMPHAPRPRPYYVMTYAEGGSLAERLKGGPLPLDMALAIFRQVTEALAYVHVKGIRHCDLKPANILLDVRGRPWIADFGQAHLSCDASPALGTFFYMAPEQANHCNQIPDTRWDVYGLGAIFYAMLTGHPPRETDELHEAIQKKTGLPERLRGYREAARSAPKPEAHRRIRGMDRDLAEIIDRCLAIDPEERLREAGSVLAMLDRRDRRRRQRPLLVLGLVASVVLLLGMIVSTLLMLRDASRAQQSLVDQLLEDNLDKAKIVARMLDDQLSKRLEAMKNRAADPELRAAIKGDDPASYWRLNAFLERHYKQTASFGYIRWTFADRGGVIRANYPIDPSVHGKNFSWRDWFHGEPDRYEERETGRHFEAIRAPHLSQPFMARGVDRKIGMNVSAPVNDADGKTPLGVLTAMIDIDEIYRMFHDESVNRRDIFVLLDRRYHCLVHKHRKRIEPEEGKNPPTWEGSPVFRDLIQGRREGKHTSHRDPIDGRDYLVSYVPLHGNGWGLLIQRERDQIMRQFGEFQSSTIRGAILVNMTICGLAASGFWGWIAWTLRRGEGPADG